MRTDASEINALITLLDDEDIEVYRCVKTALLKKHGKAALPFLKEKSQDPQNNELLNERLDLLTREIKKDSLQSSLQIWFEEGGEDLIEGLWLVAIYENPQLNLDVLRKQIDDLVFEAWKHYKYSFSPFEQVQMLNKIFFEELQFRANIQKFHQPENSMINIILENRASNPIGLCVVYMLIAQSLKFPIYGVNLPNLFVLTYKNNQQQFYINVFNKGVIFSKLDVENYITQLRLTPDEQFFEPCKNTDIVRRIINNLIVSYDKSGEVGKSNDMRKINKAIGQ